MVLPVLGGAPSVWAVTICFFQGGPARRLLHAHLLMRGRADTRHRLRPPRVLRRGVLLALPIGLPSSWPEPPAREPYLWQLGLFAVAIGLPFIAGRGQAPLLQAYGFSNRPCRRARPVFPVCRVQPGKSDCLLGYPLVPGARVVELAQAPVDLGFAPGARAMPPASTVSSGPAVPTARGPRPHAPRCLAAPTWSDRLGWIRAGARARRAATAFTAHMTTDIASAPLLWVSRFALSADVRARVPRPR